MFKKFKEFALGSNVLDLAIGVMMGTAIGNVVSALVKEIFLPLIGLMLGKIDFEGIAITVGNTTFGIGIFIQAVITFLVTALVLFLIVQAATKANELTKKEKEEEDKKEEKTPTTEELLLDIKKLLETQNKAK